MRGPFEGADSVQQFHETCGIEIDGEIPVLFTHNDLVGVNIMLSFGSKPRVSGVIDWGQSGWYPAYWEYCKARGVGFAHPLFCGELVDEWHERYLPLIVDAEDEEKIWYAFRWFVYDCLEFFTWRCDICRPSAELAQSTLKMNNLRLSHIYTKHLEIFLSLKRCNRLILSCRMAKPVFRRMTAQKKGRECDYIITTTTTTALSFGAPLFLPKAATPEREVHTSSRRQDRNYSPTTL